MVEALEITHLKILLLDDHVIFSQGLSELLKQIVPNCEIKTTETVSKASKELEARSFDFILSDIVIPGSDVRAFIKQCKRRHQSIKIIILSSLQEIPTVKEFLELGVDSYISKAVNAIEMKMAFEKNLAGEKYISTDISSKLANNFFEDARSPLTKKELEVLRMVAAGHTVLKIADALSISASTVMAHRRNIMSKLDLHSAAALVKYAFENNLV